MSIAGVCALLLVLGVSAAGMRRLLAIYRMDAKMRSALWRTAVLLVLPLLSAGLLYLTLFPPETKAPAGQLTVLTANAEVSADDMNGAVIALPEAKPIPGVAKAPDLATALRQRPGLQNLRILGDGLPARDREGLSGLSVTFKPAGMPVGLIDFWQTPVITPGAMWSVRGRINGVPNAGVRLHDPAGKVAAQTVVGGDGDFVLSAAARGPGLAEYGLKITDGSGKLIETMIVPIVVREPEPLAILSLSGGPNAELKTLRRWAVDAGVRLESRIALGPGMVFQTGKAAITAANLRDSDWLIVDERAWDGLSGSEKRTVREAVAGGMGLLLRITGPLSNTASADFADLGYRIRNTNLVQSVRLPEAGEKPQWPSLNRRPISVQGDSAETVIADSNNEPLALWRPLGQGRVGVLWLTDSYRLSLAGYPEVYARIWSALAKSLARPQRVQSPLAGNGLLHPDQRAVFCQVQSGAKVVSPDGSKTEILVEPLPMQGQCAGFWPMASGWHYLENGPSQYAFFVHPASQGLALDRQRLQQATRQLAAMSAKAADNKQIAMPGQHWPFFLAWLLLSCLMWLLERSRWGMRIHSAAS